FRAVVDEAGGDGDAIVVLEARPLQRDRRDRQGGGLPRRHVDRRQRGPLRQLDVVTPGRLLPAAALEIADQDDLAARQRRLAEQADRELQRRREARRPRPDRGGGESRLETAAIAGRA